MSRIRSAGREAKTKKAPLKMALGNYKIGCKKISGLDRERERESYAVCHIFTDFLPLFPIVHIIPRLFKI
jgi:hypothetical protein